MNSLNMKEPEPKFSAQLKRRRLPSLKKNESISNSMIIDDDTSDDIDEIHLEKKGLIDGQKIIDNEKISSGTVSF
jgi:hypothetical protein